MLNSTKRIVAICAMGLLAACGGGGGGGGNGTPNPVPGGPTGGGDTTPMGGGGSMNGGGGDVMAVPANVLAAQGLYVGPSSIVLVTPDGRALIALEGTDSFNIIDTALVDSNGVVTLSDATAFTSDRGAVQATGMFEFPTDPSLKPLLQVDFGGVNLMSLDSFPDDYNTPSSLERIANTYTDETVSLTVDSAGQVSGLDSSTNCAITGTASADMPLINAYALQLTVSMCADATMNGTYTGRASVLNDEEGGQAVLILAHSSSLPLNIPILFSEGTSL